MSKLPDCPARAQCKNGCFYPNGYEGYGPCMHRHRNDDGIFVCSGFEEKELVTLDKLPDPDIELFPDHDYTKEKI